ncbi:branched-chain amino acid ABC transporter permease [Ornithinimicrobium cavernae]|uniref:branched-chain amino acid ABC transporter permease n=1 Tax=Ornithinimicrobium cavernae TaxID=2666047 RepID=UPI000D68C2F9|nr:branched-chain amino acid ABC transporter permease [Ornithinimicrobium cavernae]
MTRQRIVALLVLVACLLWILGSNGFGVGAAAALLPVLTTAGVYAVGGVGLNLQYGHGGLLNFGFVAFMTVGAYVMVLLLPHRSGPGATVAEGVVPLPVALVLATLAAAFLGLLCGIPAIRLRSDYLAIVMIAVAEILRILARDIPSVTGGVHGVLNYSDSLQDLRPEFVDGLADALNVQAFQLWLCVVAWASLVAVTLLVKGLMQTPWGLMLKAVRDDELAVRSLGKSPTVLKLQALALGGAIGGLAGGLLAFQLSQVNPDVFIPQITFFIFAIVTLGGTGSTWGPALGAVVFWTLLTESGALVSQVLGSGTAASATRYVIVGVLLVLLINFRPQGLLGRRRDVVLEF